MAAVRPSAAPPPPAPAGGDPLTYEGVMAWLNRYQDTQPSFNAGEVIRQADLEKLRPFLPPGYFEKLDFPELEVEIQETLDVKPHNSYTQATFQYGGQTGIAADGAITNYIAGRPFSDERILATTPEEAGLMIAWNHTYRWQHMGYRVPQIPIVYVVPGEGGSRNAVIDAAMFGGGHVERSLSQAFHRVYLSHVASLDHQDYAIDVRDSKKYYFKDWMEMTEPFDMRGMAFVIERFRDPRALDQANSYLPTERRIRRLSAKERADGFAGGEFTLDDFEGFTGRPLDYEWKYLGQKDLIYVQDSKHEHLRFFGPLSDVPSDQWQLRKMFAIESVPLYTGHTYGKKLMFYDAQTFNIAMVVVFDREDRLLKVFNCNYNSPGGDSNGDPSKTVNTWWGSVGHNFQAERSTVTWTVGADNPTMKASKVRRMFSVSNLTGGR